MGWFLTSADSWSLQALQLVALLRRWMGSYKTVTPGISTHHPGTTRACTTNEHAWSIKPAWDFAGLMFKRSLGETMPLKFRVYNQSFPFGSWRQLFPALLLYSALSDVPKHPTKRLSLQSRDSKYLQQCSAASISESVNTSLQTESTLTVSLCTSTLKNNFRKQMSHCRAIKKIK